MGTLRVSTDSTPKVPRCWCGPEGTCDPDQAGFSASLINAVLGPVRLDWSRCCVPLTRGLNILWRVLWWSLQVSRNPGAVMDQKGGNLFFKTEDFGHRKIRDEFVRGEETPPYISALKGAREKAEEGDAKLHSRKPDKEKEFRGD